MVEGAQGTIGRDVPGWEGAKPPRPVTLEGRFGRLEPLDAERHAAQFFAALEGRAELWTYLPWPPATSSAGFFRLLSDLVADPGYAYFAILDREEAPVGMASFMRAAPEHGCVEVGGILMAPALQRTPLATEAMSLMMTHAFEGLGNRRYEWKCDSLNAPSRRAAIRLGFSFEGIFRNHMVIKGRNRDTAWFGLTREDWPAVKEAHALWLSPGNFEAEGRQKERLSALTALTGLTPDTGG